jgi:hypothetical protein
MITPRLLKSSYNSFIGGGGAGLHGLFCHGLAILGDTFCG